MRDKYISKISASGKVVLRSSLKENFLENINGLILDCDGVLINNFDLYHEAVKQTVKVILSPFIKEILIPRSLYYMLKSKGTFNNDWDVSFCFISSLIAGNDEIITNLTLIDEQLSPKDKLNSIRRFDLAKNANYGSLNLLVKKISSPSVDDIARVLSVDVSLIRKLSRILLLPKVVGEGLIPTILEEIYHGSLIKEIYGVEGILGIKKGLIEKEKLEIKEEEMSYLFSKFNGKIGILSGRPRKSAEYALSRILPFISKSFFMEEGGDKKPDPSLLEKIMKNLGMNFALVVGDSAEDIFLVENARRIGLRCLSCGITGGHKWKLKLFKSLKADIICNSFRSLIEMLR